MKILYFSTVNWKWIKQRPHFISSLLSQQGNHEVDFLSLTPFGKTFIRKRKMNSFNINDQYTLPFSLKFEWIERLNIAYIKKLLLRRNYDMIILTHPLHYRYIPKRLISSCSLIYECMDNMPYFYDEPLKSRIFSEEAHTLDIVDAVITSSDHLKVELQKRSSNKRLVFHTIYNALDAETFQIEPKNVKLYEPNIVYIGTISHWLDWEVIIQFALDHPNFAIYLIGPLEVKKILPPNIIWVKPIQHHQVIDFIHAGDIMLLPFEINNLTKAVDPVKLYEYLGMDKPVVSAYWAELSKFKSDNIFFYSDYRSFVKSVRNAYERKENRTINRAFITENNWNNRVNEYIDFIQKIAKKKKDI